MQTPMRHDDLDELRQKKLGIPPVFRRGAWIALPLGAGGDGAPGPSGTQLLIWLPVGPDAATDAALAPTWAQVEAAVGAPGAASSRTVPRAAAVLWDGAPGGGPETVAEADHIVVRGAEYPQAAGFGNIFWKHGWALGTRAGLLVSLVSG